MKPEQREKVEALLVGVLPTLLEMFEEANVAQEHKNAQGLRRLFAAHVLGGFVARSGPPDKALHSRFATEALMMADAMLAQLGFRAPGPLDCEGVVADSAALAMDRRGKEDEPVGSIPALGPPREGTRVWLFRREATTPKSSQQAALPYEMTMAVPVNCVGVIAATSGEAKRMLATTHEPVASLDASHALYGQDQRIWLFRPGY